MPITTKKIDTLEYLVCDAISVPHAFTTRYGGVSQGHLAGLNLAMHRGDRDENVEKNYAILGQALGFTSKDLVFTHQIHSDIIRRVGRRDCGGVDHHTYPECDALITNDPGVALVVFTADCTPILLSDPVTGAVGAVHAGWRGTAADIAGKTVRAMEAAFGCNPKNIRAAIGPNIGQCCFQTDADVPQAMEAAYGHAAEAYIRPRDGKFYVDLKGINALSLKNAGVQFIHVDNHCTACDPIGFWSHRVHGAQRGSQGAIIVCKEGTF